jgi:TRAP-type C4-dicarboxylate transport system permease small subunit
MKMSRSFIRIVDWINHKTLFCIVILFFIAFVMLFIQIIFRYVLRLPFLIGDEVSRYSTVWIVYIAASLAARHNRLVRMEVLLSLSSVAEKNKRVFDWISGIASIFFYLSVIKFGLQMMGLSRMQFSPVLHLSMSIPYLALPVGSALLVVNTIACLLDTESPVVDGSVINLEEVL